MRCGRVKKNEAKEKVERRFYPLGRRARKCVACKCQRLLFIWVKGGGGEGGTPKRRERLRGSKCASNRCKREEAVLCSLGKTS